MSDLSVAGAPREERELRKAASAGAEGLERRLFVALAGGVLLATSWVSSLAGAHPQVAQIPAAVGAVALLIPLLIGAWREVTKGRPSSDSLASLAVLAALATSHYLMAGVVALFLWTANLILSRTAWGAQRAIRDLLDLTPDVARVVHDPAAVTLKKGEIIVAHSTDPGWIYLLTTCGGLVVERGSVLSHTAIIGRELGIPTVVGVVDATTRIPDNSEIAIDGATGVVTWQ